MQFSREKTLKLLLQGEGEGEPAHVGGLPALPEINYTLEVLLRLFVLLLPISPCSLLTLLLFLLFILVLHRHPVSNKAQKVTSKMRFFFIFEINSSITAPERLVYLQRKT